MQEEFYGATIDGVWKGKLLYGWGTLNANVWLPSLSELVGITGTEHPTYGCYNSAMQGLNTSVNGWTDAKGGNQFAYFRQFNASGGGQKLWDACSQQQSWLRSSNTSSTTLAWLISGINTFSSYDAFPLTASHAVHPAHRNKFHIPRTGFHCRDDR